MIKIAPSILSADFRCLSREIKRAEAAGADMLHIDVMDGHFVPNITIGPCVIKHIRKTTSLPLDVHLMIQNPGELMDAFIAAGSDMITVHIEAVLRTKDKGLRERLKDKEKTVLRTKDKGLRKRLENKENALVRDKLKGLREKLKSKGVKLGVSLNPNTPLSKIIEALPFVDFVLVMSVNPGFSGQAFIPSVIPKIKKLRSVFAGDISVDGGVDDKVAGQLINAGANILAAGSYIFGAKNIKEAIERIRNA